jgi:hypothetical protein
MKRIEVLLPVITILVIAGGCSLGIGINDYIELNEFSQWLGGFHTNSVYCVIYGNSTDCINNVNNTVGSMTFDNPEISSFVVYQWYIQFELFSLVKVVFEVLLGLLAFAFAGILYCVYEIKSKSDEIPHIKSDTIIGGNK